MPRLLIGVTVAMTAQAFLQRQLVGLAERGWEIHLVCSPDDGTDSWTQLQQLSFGTMHPIHMHRPLKPLSDIRALIAWIHLIERLQPDVVIASTPKAGLLGMLAARIHGVKTRIYHVRGLRLESLTGIQKIASWAAERVSITSSTSVLVDGPSLLGQMRRLGLLGRDQGLVLGKGSSSGVDTEHFRPPSIDERQESRESLRFGPDDFVVGFLGRLTTDKGVMDLIDAIANLSKKYRHVRLALVGPRDGDKKVDSKLRQLENAAWLRTPGFTGDARQSYWAFDVFCLPSHREGFPISPLEAQACGLPVVTTRATGCADAIIHDTTGLAVDVGDSTALEFAIMEFMTDSNLRTQMGAAGRSRVVNHFGSEQVAVEFIRFIEELTA